MLDDHKGAGMIVGTWRKNASIASNPPAEAPIATTYPGAWPGEAFATTDFERAVIYQLLSDRSLQL